MSDLPKRLIKGIIPKKRKEYEYKYILIVSDTQMKEGTVWASGMATATQKIAGLYLSDKVDYKSLFIEKTAKER